jgi:hypothetical protein
MHLPLLIAAAVQAAPATAGGYPAAAVYAAFAQGCAEVRDFAKARTALTAAGWEAYEAAPDSPTGKLVKLGTDMLDKDEYTLRPGATFRRTVAGERLELILSGVESKAGWTNGCRVYDFDETRQVPVAAVTARLGREPDETTQRAGLLSKARWSPGLRPDHEAVELYFVPAGSPAVALLGSSGICMVAKASGELN